MTQRVIPPWQTWEDLFRAIGKKQWYELFLIPFSKHLCGCGGPPRQWLPKTQAQDHSQDPLGQSLPGWVQSWLHSDSLRSLNSATPLTGTWRQLPRPHGQTPGTYSGAYPPFHMKIASLFWGPQWGRPPQGRGSFKNPVVLLDLNTALPFSRPNHI